MKNTVTNFDSNIEFWADTGEIKDRPLLKCYFLNMALLQCPNHFLHEYAQPNTFWNVLPTGWKWVKLFRRIQSFPAEKEAIW